VNPESFKSSGAVQSDDLDFQPLRAGIHFADVRGATEVFAIRWRLFAQAGTWSDCWKSFAALPERDEPAAVRASCASAGFSKLTGAGIHQGRMVRGLRRAALIADRHDLHSQTFVIRIASSHRRKAQKMHGQIQAGRATAPGKSS
jgi:hypothetical protein